MKQVITVISQQEAILEALHESRMNNSIIGIHCKALGSATYLTGVREILLRKNEEPLVVLTGYDITGYFLQRTTLRLSEIISVIPFTSPFENPYFKNFKKRESLNPN
jgi:hypothetical protein